MSLSKVKGASLSHPCISMPACTCQPFTHPWTCGLFLTSVKIIGIMTYSPYFDICLMVPFRQSEYAHGEKLIQATNMASLDCKVRAKSYTMQNTQ